MSLPEKLVFSRRTLLQAAAGLPLLAVRTPAPILPGVSIISDAVNTVCVQRHRKTLLIDSGDLTTAPGGGIPDWAFFTHHHRDQASGAAQLSAAGARIVAPVEEQRFFDDAHSFWDQADNIFDHRYNFRPQLFTLREPVTVARGVRGGDKIEWEGLTFEVIATPGHTDGSVTYIVQIAGKRVAMTGDLISGPGQIWEIYSLQKRFPGMSRDYWGFGGAVRDVKASLDRVLAAKPDILIPSHGVVMDDPATAVAQLKQNLDAAMDNFLQLAGWRISPRHKGEYPRDEPPQMFPPLPAVNYPPWIRDIASTTKAIVADDKSVFLSDCGSVQAIDELARLQSSGEIGAIDGLWITHYHDDHTESVNVAKRQFGAKVHVQRELADIIENPTAFQMPCLFPESIRVDRVLEHGETFQWKEFQLTAYHFPGQTLFHDGLLVERDGFKVFLTGDSFTNWGVDDYCSQNRCFLGPGMGYEKCLQILLDTKPDVLAAAHWGAKPVSTEYLRRTLALFKQRELLMGKLFPHDNVNFGLDPCWARAYPYRQSVLPGATMTVEARVMNHSSTSKRVRAGLKLPRGWKAEVIVGEKQIPARTEGRIRFTAIAPEAPERRRDVLGLTVTIDGKPFGEFAEAIVNFVSTA